jgi:hypothetical protein
MLRKQIELKQKEAAAAAKSKATDQNVSNGSDNGADGDDAHRDADDVAVGDAPAADDDDTVDAAVDTIANADSAVEDDADDALFGTPKRSLVFLESGSPIPGLVLSGKTHRTEGAGRKDRGSAHLAEHRTRCMHVRAVRVILFSWCRSCQDLRRPQHAKLTILPS